MVELSFLIRGFVLERDIISGLVLVGRLHVFIR